MNMEMTPSQEPVMTARAELVAILEELHDVLVRIDDVLFDSYRLGRRRSLAVPAASSQSTHCTPVSVT